MGGLRRWRSGNACTITEPIELRNSKARHAGQYDDQKVTFYSALNKRTIGEIEDRHDSATHYRQMKFRLNAKGVIDVLTTQYPNPQEVRPQVLTHGKAMRMFK